MKQILKVAGAVCLGIFIWILVWVCIIFVLNLRTEGKTEGLGNTAKEAVRQIRLAVRKRAMMGRVRN